MPRMYTIEDWKARTIAEGKDGNTRVGSIGVACPICWKKIPACPTDDPQWCHHEIADGDEVMEALGLECFGRHLTTNNDGIVLD